MQCEEKTVFKFKELSKDAKQSAIEHYANGNLDYDWWDGIYEDAASMGLEITSFDLDRSKHAEGKFIWTEQKVASAILALHGEDCETYKTSAKFLATAVLFDQNDTEDENMDKWTALCEHFLKDILNNYADMLQSECDYLQSAEAITETILANDYDFDEDGNMV